MEFTFLFLSLLLYQIYLVFAFVPHLTPTGTTLACSIIKKCASVSLYLPLLRCVNKSKGKTPAALHY